MLEMIKKNQSSLVVFLSIVLIYLFTNNPLTAFLKLQLVILVLFLFILYTRTVKIKGPVYFYFLVALVLTLVGATGWYFSPFFFLLYFTSLMLSFVFEGAVAVVFLITLAALFGLNMGQVDITYDFLTILSLLGVIPLSLYLRKEYLKLKEKDKSILVLKNEKEQAYKNVIEEALANKVNSFAITLRQPINDIKQLVYFIQHSDDKKKNETHLEEIEASSEEALALLKTFEEETTGKKLTFRPKIS